MNKKKYYQEQVESLTKAIWKWEFKIFRLKTLREGFRVEYDRLKEMVDALEVRTTKLKERNAEGDIKEVEQVNNQIEKYNQDINQFKEQMQGIDNEIEGFNYMDDHNQERHHQGIVEVIGQCNDEKEALKEFIKTL